MADPKKYISKIVNGSDTLYIKDAEAQADIADIKSSITGGMHYLGKSTTAIADGDATGPWVIDGVTYVASNPTEGQKALKAGDIAIYGELEFIWSGTSGKWQEFGSTGSLKALAFKDNASGDFTPAGTNAPSAVTFAGQADDDFVTGYNDDAVAPTFSEGAFTPASLAAGFYTPGTAPSYSEGAFDEGTLPSFTEGAFSAGTLPSLGDATTGNFTTEGVVSSYAEATETLTLSAASTSAAVTAQGTFSAGTLPSKVADTWNAGTLPSKSADTWSAGTPTAIDTSKFSGGSKAADTFNAGSAATLATGKAITAVGTGTAAAQVFTGTQDTVTVS